MERAEGERAGLADGLRLGVGTGASLKGNGVGFASGVGSGFGSGIGGGLGLGRGSGRGPGAGRGNIPVVAARHLSIVTECPRRRAVSVGKDDDVGVAGLAGERRVGIVDFGGSGGLGRSGFRRGGFGRGGFGRVGFGRGGGDAGAILVVEGDVEDGFLGSGGGFDLVHLAEGFEGGVHEVGESADVAVVDGAGVKGFENGVEVVEDGSVVFHVGEADKRGGGVAGGVAGFGGFGAAEAPLVVAAELLAAQGGHGAAGAVEAKVTAAGEVVLDGVIHSGNSPEKVPTKKKPSREG